MSRFHTFTRNDSSSESGEDGEVIDDDLQDIEQTHESETNNLDDKSLKPSKSLQILDKIESKRKRFSVWSDFLLEDELNHSVSNAMDIKKKRQTNRLDRQSENYSFWTKRELEDNSDQLAERDSDPNQSTSHLNINMKNKRKKTKKRKKDKKESDKRVDFALEMAHKLNEPKIDLIRKVCHAIGEQKTGELCAATLDIESAGGLMTVDGKRRRTAGGVFFQLLKSDATISKDSIDFIFTDQQKKFHMKNKQKKRDKHKGKKSSQVKHQSDTSNTKVAVIDNQMNQSLIME